MFDLHAYISLEADELYTFYWDGLTADMPLINLLRWLCQVGCFCTPYIEYKTYEVPKDG